VVVELSQSTWLVAGIVPGVARQPLKKLGANQEALLALHITRHSPDDRAFDRQTCATYPFWQEGRRCAAHNAGSIRQIARPDGRISRFCFTQDACLPWVWRERITTERFTRALDQAAGAVPRSRGMAASAIWNAT
jgi:hypothetical protein